MPLFLIPLLCELYQKVTGVKDFPSASLVLHHYSPWVGVRETSLQCLWENEENSHNPKSVFSLYKVFNT